MASAAKKIVDFKLPIRMTLWAFLLLWLDPTAATETAKGSVFDDRNRNGFYDKGENGVSGVAVSNGEELVLTDDSGSYELEIESGEVLFFSKPRGFALPLSKDNIPRFYYAHFPDGTTSDLEYQYGGMEPTGALPGQIDFPVYQTSESETFKVIWTSDPQVSSHEELDFVRDDVVAELVGAEAAFGLTTGDIMYDDLSLYPRYASIFGQIGVPWFNVPGNHDSTIRLPQTIAPWTHSPGTLAPRIIRLIGAVRISSCWTISITHGRTRRGRLDTEATRRVLTTGSWHGW